MFRWWRSISLVTVLGVVLGFLSNYYTGGRVLGFVSPTVLGQMIRDPGSRVLSPFGLLSSREKRADLISPTGSLSLANPVDRQLGSILGESTLNQNQFSSTNPVLSAPVTSNSSNLSASATTTSNGETTASTAPTSSPSTVSSSVLTATQQAIAEATNVVLGYLKSGNYTGLYNLMSSDFKNTFNAEDFVASFSSSPVSSGSTTADPRIFGANNEWGEQSIKLVLADGSFQGYLNIYHLENASWTLYATQDQ